MMRVAVVGSTGQLGSDLVSHLEGSGTCRVFPLSHADIDCGDPAAVRKVLGSCSPDVVVNCAAFVRVDDCEDRREDAFRVNARGARFVAETCAALEATCVYISTDYVFDGEKRTPYSEKDPTSPLSVYGLSKEAGEQSVRTTLEQHHIVRRSTLFGVAGASGKAGNFITTMLRLAREGRDIGVVDDQRFSPPPPRPWPRKSPNTYHASRSASQNPTPIPSPSRNGRSMQFILNDDRGARGCYRESLLAE